MSQQARASARLLRDLKEVLQQPLPDVNALPCNDDLLVWHGNVRGQDAVLGESLVHFVMVFPSDYPQKAPGVWLYTPVPHPNVISQTVPSLRVAGANWKLAMWDCIPGQDAWSSAYTVHSILLQLQVFLLDEDLQWDTSKVSREAAMRLADDLVVPACGHCPGHPFPPLPTPQDLAQAASAQCKIAVTRPMLKPRAAASPDCSAAVSAANPAAASDHASQRSTAPSGPAQATPTWLLHAATGPLPQTAPSAGLAAGKAPASQQATALGQVPGAACTGPSFAPATAAAEPSAQGQKPAVKGLSGQLSAAEAAQSPANSAAGADGWVEVRHKGSKRKLVQTPAKAAGSAAQVPSPSSGTETSRNAFQALQAEGPGAAAASPSHALAADRVGATAQSAGAGNVKAEVGTSKAMAGAGAASVEGEDEYAGKGLRKDIPGATLILSKAAKKNAARSAKRAAKHGTKTSSPGGTAPAVAFLPAASTQTSQAPEPDWVPVKGASAAAKAAPSGSAECAKAAPKTHAELIQDAYKQHAETMQAAKAGTAGAQTAAAGDRSMAGAEPGCPGSLGPLLDQLPPDTLSSIMCLLGADDLARLGSTCHGLKMAVDDGLVWRSMLQREFPLSQLTASSAADWKHTYLLQASAVMGDLQCFFTKHPMAEACLGLPLRYTMNPKTQQLDYIEAGLDLVSLDAVHSGWVAKSPDGQDIQACLPLYLTYEHFERVKAGRGLQKALRALAPEQIGTGGATPPAAAWLHIMPKLLNTAIVLLMDKGVAASERALITYCSLHRLFLALAEDFHLFSLAAERLDRFLKVPASRTKAQTPNMGWFIPLLTLGMRPDHTWKRMASMIVEEGLDRSIIWICKQNPSLQESLMKDPDSGGADTDLLKQAFAACCVGLKLIAFHVAFLALIARPQGSTLQQVMEGYDGLYGRPGPAMQKKMRQVAHKILAMDSWATYLRMLGLPAAGDVDAFMTRRLRLAWRNSLQKRYLSKGMDFSRVQASGVSKLILKGQQYSAPPNMQRIHVLDKWRFPEHMQCYLDATMFLLAKDGRIIDTVDFSHTHSQGTRMTGAVSHSGDMMEATHGTHTIDVQLAQLGANVASLVLVLSAYIGSRLDDMRQPFVIVEDPVTKMPLCEYHLEDHAKEVLASHKAVVMCRIFLSSTGVWKVEALGQLLPEGHAGRYGPIKNWLAQQEW